MRQWQRSAQVIGHILQHEFPYPKLRLIASYLRLVCHAYLHRQDSPLKKHSVHFFGFTITFRNYPECLTLVEEIFVYQIYQFKSPKHAPMIVDAGANIGIATLYFKKCYPRCRIMCFEPDSGNLELLNANIKNNGLQDVSVYPIALSSVNGGAVLYQPGPGSINAGLIETVIHKTREEVECRRLSTFLTQPTDLLKLDIEGSEEKVLDDLIANSKLSLVGTLIIEHHPIVTGNHTNTMVEKLIEAGFICQLQNLESKTTDTLIRGARQ